MSRFFEIAQKIVNNSYFNRFVFSIILLSTVVIGLETYPGLVNSYQSILTLIDKFVIVIFTLEIALKIMALVI